MALKEVSPEELGFKPAPKEDDIMFHPEREDDADRALDVFDKVIIPKKLAEMQKFNEILEETGGNISKQEMNDLLGYGFANELLGKKPIPLNTEPMIKVEKARGKKNGDNTKITTDSNESVDEIDSILSSVKTGFEDDFDDEDDF